MNFEIYQIQFSCKWKKFLLSGFEILKTFPKPTRYFSKLFFEKTNLFLSKPVFFYRTKTFSSHISFIYKNKFLLIVPRIKFAVSWKNFSKFPIQTTKKFLISIWSDSIVKKFLYVNLINFKIYYECTSLWILALSAENLRFFLFCKFFFFFEKNKYNGILKTHHSLYVEIKQKLLQK